MNAVQGTRSRERRHATAHRFEMTVTATENASLIRVAGPLDVHYSRTFLEKARPLCAGEKRVILDLRNTDYVDSAGVRALIELDHRLGSGKGELRLVVMPSSRVERVLSLLKLLERFRVHPTLTEAWIEKLPD